MKAKLVSGPSWDSNSELTTDKADAESQFIFKFLVHIISVNEFFHHLFLLFKSHYASISEFYQLSSNGRYKEGL